MSILSNIKISLRKDSLTKWTEKNPVLKNGEIAIVTDDDGNDALKIGNGLSSFTQLPYVFQNKIKSDDIQAKYITAKSISQGYNVKATPTSFGTGIFTEASANFGVVHGIEAQILSGDDYAFVFNGENLPGITERYTSHGEGSFNINPLSGLAGFYIGETNLSTIFSEYYKKTQTYNIDEINQIVAQIGQKFADYYKKTETSSSLEISSALKNVSVDLSNSLFDIQEKIDNKIEFGEYVDQEYVLQKGNLSVVTISDIEYHALITKGEILSNTIYIVSADNLNAFENTIVNVAEPILSSDAATKNYVDVISNYLSSQIPTKTSQLINDSGFLSAHQSLSDYETISDLILNYYKKSETSSSLEISTLVNNLLTQLSNKVLIGNYSNNEYNLIQKDLSVVRISENDFYNLVATSSEMSDAIYIVSSDILNAHDKVVKNVATPSALTDAANKQYVDNSLSNVIITGINCGGANLN